MLKSHYPLSRQFIIRMTVHLNSHTLKYNTTDILYYGNSKIARIRIAKRINMIRKGKVKIDRFLMWKGEKND